MPFLDASALTQDPESLEFLRDVLGPPQVVPTLAERFSVTVGGEFPITPVQAAAVLETRFELAEAAA